MVSKLNTEKPQSIKTSNPESSFSSIQDFLLKLCAGRRITTGIKFNNMSAVFILGWLILILTIPQNAYAIGSGAFSIGLGDTESLGKGVAFTGEADNPSAVYYNPAGLTQLKGQQASVGFSVIDIRVTHETTSGNKSQLQRHPVLVPHLYYTNNFGMDKVTIGLGGNGTWGAGFEWNPDDTARRYNVTQSELYPLDNYISMGYAVNDQLSLGIGTNRSQMNADLEKKIFQSTGLDDADFQLKGSDSSWGYNLSAVYKVNEQHQFGLKYQSAVDLNFEGNVTLTGLNGTGSNFASIFGGSSYSTKAKTQFTEPQSVTLGYSYQPNNKWRLNADLEWMDWSSTDELKVEYPDETNATRLGVLATGNQSLDWKAIFSYAAGAEYQANDHMRLRGGYFYRPTPIPDANFDAWLPDANSHGVTVGFGYDFTKDLILDMSYAARFMEKRKIDNTVGNAVGGNVDGTYTEFMNIVMATMTYKFDNP